MQLSERKVAEPNVSDTHECRRVGTVGSDLDTASNFRDSPLAPSEPALKEFGGYGAAEHRFVATPETANIGLLRQTVGQIKIGFGRVLLPLLLLACTRQACGAYFPARWIASAQRAS